jgi:hypothetical protein
VHCSGCCCHLQIKQACFWQLPPHRFWLHWCEGLTVLEAFLVTSWAAMHIILARDMVADMSKGIEACTCSAADN